MHLNSRQLTLARGLGTRSMTQSAVHGSQREGSISTR
jgi:hypothetical protein